MINLCIFSSILPNFYIYLTSNLPLSTPTSPYPQCTFLYSFYPSKPPKSPLFCASDPIPSTIVRPS